MFDPQTTTMTDTTTKDARVIKTKFDRNPSFSFVIDGKNVTRKEMEKYVRENKLTGVIICNDIMHTIWQYK